MKERDPAAAGMAGLVDAVLGPQPAGLQAILDSVPAYIWYKDRNNRILRLNRLAAESSGLSVEKAEGQSVWDVYPDQAARYYEDDLEVINSGQPKLGIVETLATATGEKRWVRTDKIPYRAADGEIVGVIVFAVDISERVRTEEALQRAHEDLQRSVDERTQQLAAAVQILNAETAERRRAEARIDQQQAELAHVLRLYTLEGMAAQLAHEINQPLAAIVNFAAGLERRLGSGEVDVATTRRIVDRINREALRAAAVVRRLRSSVRKDDRKRERCDLAEVARSAASMIEAEARSAGVALQLDFDPAAPRVEVDCIQAEQVVLNLLRNALDAIRSGPRGTHAIRLETLVRDDCIEVRVHDTGPGLPVEDVAVLLEPFFTTKPQGLGMGLSISQRIVEAHGGTLWGFGNPEGGATFAFTVPLPQPATPLGAR